MELKPDLRHFGEITTDQLENHMGCRKCGTSLIILPEDKRQGFCFDCVDLLETSNKFEIEEGRLFSPNNRNIFSLG